MTTISNDLPDYFKTPQSIYHSKSVKFSRKCLKTPLTQGVSIEAPDFFRIPYVPIISTTQRKELLSRDGERFERDLKKYQITPTKGFNYCDFQQSNFDYDSVSLVNRVNLCADRNPRLKKTGGFANCYKKFLIKGFGINRGEFTVENINPKILRNHSDKARSIQNLIKKKSKKRIEKLQITTSPRQSPKKDTQFKIKIKTPSQKVIRHLDDIDKFETSIQKTPMSMEDRRKIYIINRN
ncbi:hypothetical protein SteCoe_5945 [Stentor coeruleus]|uniref:Uncharacterized protein n=1 Tax=Stentor coeruleus TaxID=5963 RepID=A0A1R2CR29_9CILI|nr:hypothetical protein SteCoe_5945 [Stentor coeruleus]